MHLMALLEPKIDHDQARAYAKRIAQRLAATAPDRYTLSSAPEKRAGRIFIDYLRNGRGTTAVGAWSPRARAGFPIAVPVSWRQIENGIRPDAFTMEKAAAQIACVVARWSFTPLGVLCSEMGAAFVTSGSTGNGGTSAAVRSVVIPAPG